jgi:autotransporter-associated beta strand protein
MTSSSFTLFHFLRAWLLSAAMAAAQTGTGLTGRYYDDHTFTAAALVTTRTDASIHFDWGTAIPSGTALTSGDTFAVAWTGQIEPQFTELYTFHLIADDAARLWVNDECIAVRSFFQGTGEMRGQMRLRAGHRANIRIEYLENTGNARVRLEWASASQPRQVVPTARLHPTTEIPNGGAVMREVWHGLPGASIATMTSNSSYPNRPASREFLASFECLAQSWEDSFGTRVTGFIRAPISGSYTFAVSGDEMVQLYLSTDTNPANRTLVASTANATAFRDFTAHPSQQSAPRTLVAGQRYYVELLHKEDTGADHWSVAWQKPGDTALSIIPGTALMMPGTDRAKPGTSSYFNTLATEQPRLGATRERFTWLKQAYLSPTASAAKRRAQAVISLANTDLTTAANYGNDIPRLALAWWLTGDAAYAERVWTRAQGIMANGDLTVKWKGFTLRSLSYAYDWLYPYWDDTQRTTMLNFLINRGLNRQTNHYGNNIGILNDSGFILASLAVGTGNESAAEADLAQAVTQLERKIDQWEPNNGVWLEGTDYGIFAKLGLADGMLSMETALGSTFSASRVPGFFTTRREPLSIASNIRQRFTFSDVGTGSNNPMGWANWWARRFDAPEVYDFSRQIGNSTWNALLVPETTISPAQAQLQPDQCFIGPADGLEKGFQHVATLRQNWSDSRATFVGGMGGTYMSHGMLQSGTFQLSARGVNWFVDLKSEGYDIPNHNSTTPNPNGRDRWDYYRNRAEGHNCLVVNPSANPDRIWNAPPAPMIAYQSAPQGQRSFAVWDLSRNIAGVTRVQRGIQLLGQRKQVLVQDEIVNPTATTCWWFAHFSNSTTATIGSDGSTVTLQRGSERLWGRILGGGGVWTVRAATPLPTSPNPPENADNSAFSKLAIQLTGVTNTTLAVWFVPLAPGESPPDHIPPVTPLASWNLVSGSEAPIASSGNADSSGAAAVDVSLSAYATDDWTPSTQMSYSVSSPVGGTVSLLPDGITARFTPAPGFNGLQSFDFTATDADGATSNTATITFSVPASIANWTSPNSGNWSSGSSWQNGIAPSSSPGNDLRFFSGQTLAPGSITATNNTGAFALNRLTLAGTGTTTTAVTLDGNPLHLVSNGIALPEVTLSGSTGGFVYGILNDIHLAADATFHASGSATFRFDGALTGPGGFTRASSTGTLILNGSNSYAGPTTIQAGTLQVGTGGDTGSLGSGPVSIAGGATLRFDRAGSVAIPNPISGEGSVHVQCASNADVLSLTGESDFTGGVRVQNGSLRVTSERQLGSGTKTLFVTSSSASLRFDGTIAPVILPPEFTIQTSNPNGAILNEAGDNEIHGNVILTSGAGNTRITSAGGTLAIAGTISPNTTGRSLELRGAAHGVIHGNITDGSSTNLLTGLSKNDAGTWTLQGENSLAGTTTVGAGRLVINGSHASGNVTVSPGATLAGRGSLTAPASINGTLAPGDGVGTITFGSTLSFGATGRLQCEIAGNSTTADRVISGGAIGINNSARLDLVFNSPGSTTNFRLGFWRNSRTWNLVSGPSRNGTFQLGTVTADSAGQAVATYGSFSLQHGPNGVDLVWTPVPGFPVIDEPLVTFLQPLANPVVLPAAGSTLRIAATAAGTDPVTYAWTAVGSEQGGTGTVTFGHPSAAETTVSISEEGEYTLRCTATNSAVSRSADLIVDVGPPADEDFSNAVAVIDPGTAPSAAAGFLANMTGVVSNATSSLWSLASGPGSVSFANPADPATAVVFSDPGTYILQLTGTNALGLAWRELEVTVSALPPGYEAWQQTNWPGIADESITGPHADPDGDGSPNDAEFIAGTDPQSNTSVPTYIWNQPLGGTWSGPANWNLGFAPRSNPLTRIEFFTGLSPAENVTSHHDLGPALTLQRLGLNGSGTGITTLTGGALAFASGATIDLGNGGILYDLATSLDLTAPTLFQGSPTAETRISGGLGGVGSLTKTATGTLEISGPHNLTGAVNVHAGTLRVSGAGTSSGAVNVRGATLTVTGGGSIAPATGATLTLGGSAIGTFHHDSSATSRFGSIIVGNGNDGAGNSTFNQSAGTLQAGSITLNNGFTGAGAGDFNISGGTLAVSGTVNASNQVAGDNIWSTITVHPASSLSIGNGLRLTGAPAAGRHAAGRVIQNGGSVTIANGLTMARSTATNTSARRGEYHLNAGLLSVNQITQDAGTDTFGTFHFNGGTLRPTASSAAFLQGITRANVRDNGALIDTGGFDITIAQPLLHSTIANDAATDGGLTKSGAGRLTLTGANTYNGPTRIVAGTLAHGSSASLATSSITIQPQAVFDVSALPNFVLTADRPVTIGINGTGSGSHGRIHAAGLEISAASVTFEIVSPMDDPVYIIATYTSKTGSAFASATPPAGYAIHYAYNGNQIALVSTNGFGGWIGGFPSLSDHGAAADPDQDRIPNLLEYVLNGNPAAAGTAILPTLDASGANFVFRFTRRVDSITDVVQFFEYGSDLTTWSHINLSTPGAPEVTLGSPAGGLQTVTIAIPKSAASGARLFGRLRVQGAP